MVRKFEIWLADLNPRAGTEIGKVRPVLIVQSDLLNEVHPSTLICPITSQVKIQSNILRVHIPKGTAQVMESCDVVIDQLRAIDNRKLLRKIGRLPKPIAKVVQENLRIVLDLDA